MKIQSELLHSFSGFAASLATRCWMNTVDLRWAFHPDGVDPADPAQRGPVIYLHWHEYILLPFYLGGGYNIAMLLSRHQDAEVLSHAARYMGFETIRGSTNRGGTAALRKSLRRTRRASLAITPDGPRGPRRRLAPGCIYLASKLGIPLAPIGLGYERPWRVMRAWDHFAVPRPYSRARLVFSPPVHIPSGLSRGGLEHYRRRTETLLNYVTSEAEQWADSGEAIAGSRPARRRAAPSPRPRRRDSAPDRSGARSAGGSAGRRAA